MVANADLYDRDHLFHTTMVIRQIYSDVLSKTLELPSDIHLVLDLKMENGATSFGYYFATHDGRCLFWLVDKDVRPLFKRVKGVKSFSHISGSSSACDHISPLIPFRICYGSRILVALIMVWDVREPRVTLQADECQQVCLAWVIPETAAAGYITSCSPTFKDCPQTS